MAPFEQKRPSEVEHGATKLVFFYAFGYVVQNELYCSRTNYIVLERTILFFHNSTGCIQ